MTQLSHRMAWFCVGLVQLLLWPFAGFASSGESAGPELLQDCDICPQLVVVKPGEFTMGSAADAQISERFLERRRKEELPAHRVIIDYPFAIGRYEISMAEFGVYAVETNFESKGCFLLEDMGWQFFPEASWQAPGFEVGDNSPATCLSYDEYAGYLQWLSERTGETYRFPTESEWEYIAQSGLSDDAPTPSYLAPDSCQRQNGSDVSFAEVFPPDWAPGIFACDDGNAHAAPVGSYKPNTLGLYDVLGNVAEYTDDCYSPSHEGAPVDGSARRAEVCPARTVKGGSWAGGPDFLRPAVRGGFPAVLRGDGHGLRVVRELRP